MKSKNLLLWACRVIAALIMLQTLYFKFTAALASILILIPKTSLAGASLALFIMIGAIATHVAILGIEVMNDGGQLFIYAIIAAIASFYIILRSTAKRKKGSI